MSRYFGPYHVLSRRRSNLGQQVAKAPGDGMERLSGAGLVFSRNAQR